MRKELFHLPDGIIYLDGNSLGPLPKAAVAKIQNTVQAEWGDMLIRGWNDAGWISQPNKLGDRVGALIGCPKDTVVLGDTLSVKVFQALSAALAMRPDRKVILSDNGNFPSDLYIAEGLIKELEKGHSLKLVDPNEIIEHLDEDVAVLMLTHVDYQTGRMHDLEALTKAAHSVGALVIWDLAHSAGAVPVDMKASNAEFAIGCTYKYLNGGPGAPAFIYAREDIVGTIEPALSGWLGHAAPFEFDLNYQPAPGITRMRVGTPPILQLAALEASLSVWEGVSMDAVRESSIELSELFIREIESRCPEFKLISPRDANQRGSQVSFAFEHGYAVMRALIARGVIGDFRTPNVMRFGFAPLYIDVEDVMRAVEIVQSVMTDKTWQKPEYQVRLAVT
ncbi:MAG: kynureninase [Pseudomonadota bacterium]